MLSTEEVVTKMRAAFTPEKIVALVENHLLQRDEELRIVREQLYYTSEAASWIAANSLACTAAASEVAQSRRGSSELETAHALWKEAALMMIAKDQSAETARWKANGISKAFLQEVKAGTFNIEN